MHIQAACLHLLPEAPRRARRGCFSLSHTHTHSYILPLTTAPYGKKKQDEDSSLLFTSPFMEICHVKTLHLYDPKLLFLILFSSFRDTFTCQKYFFFFFLVDAIWSLVIFFKLKAVSSKLVWDLMVILELDRVILTLWLHSGGKSVEIMMKYCFGGKWKIVMCHKMCLKYIFKPEKSCVFPQTNAAQKNEVNNMLLESAE